MRKAPPIVIDFPDGWPPASVVRSISAFYSDCIQRRIDSMSLTAEQKIKIIDGIIQILQHQEQSISIQANSL